MQTVFSGEGEALGAIMEGLLTLKVTLWFVFSPVQTQEQFVYGGCDNCDKHLKMKGNRELVQECTSSNFDG